MTEIASSSPLEAAVSPGTAKIAPYRTLEAWRGFASLWVVLFHASHAAVVRNPALESASLYAFPLLGALGVQIFFVVSGYCIATAACNTLQRDQSFMRFMRARIRRIYIPYWCALPIASAISIFAALLMRAGYLHASFSASSNVLHQSGLFYFTNLTLTQLAARRPVSEFLLPQAWTLCYEMAFYLIMGLLILVPALGRGERSFLSAVHAITAATLLGLLLAPQGRFYPLDLWPQFGLGVLVYDAVRHGKEARPWLWLLLASGLLLAFAVRYDLVFSLAGESSRLTYLFTLAFSLLILLLHRFDAPLSRLKVVQAFSAVGLFSYSLYLIHFLVIGIVNQGIHVLKAPERLHFVWFLLTVLAAVAAGRVFYHFCERPFVKPILQKTRGSSEPVVVGQTAE